MPKIIVARMFFENLETRSVQYRLRLAQDE